MKLRYLPILAALGFFATSCATQTASQGSSTDDIYFSSGDEILQRSLQPQPLQPVLHPTSILPIPATPVVMNITNQQQMITVIAAAKNFLQHLMNIMMKKEILTS